MVVCNAEGVDMKSLAVIGAGYCGRNLVRNYHQLGVLRTICDSRAEVLAAMKKSYPDAVVTPNFSDVPVGQDRGSGGHLSY